MFLFHFHTIQFKAMLGAGPDDTIPKTRLPSQTLENSTAEGSLQTDNFAMKMPNSILPHHASKSAIASTPPIDISIPKDSLGNQLNEQSETSTYVNEGPNDTKSGEAASAEIGIGAKPKLQPKTSLRDFLKTYKRKPEDRNKPKKGRSYKLIVIPPKDPTGNSQDNDDEDDL